MSTLAVVEEILREVDAPISVREIVERAGSRLPTRSKTPDTVVARDLSMDIKRKGEESIFIRTTPGRYTMRASWEAKLAAAAQAEAAVPRSEPATAETGDVVPQPTPVVATALPHERASTLHAHNPAPSLAAEARDKKSAHV